MDGATVKKLEIGEWTEWVSQDIIRSLGMSFIDVAGDRRTCWAVRGFKGEFVTLVFVNVD